MAMTAKMSDLGAGDAHGKARVGRNAAKKIRNIRDDREEGSVTDEPAEHVHEECPSCTCKSSRSKSASADGKIKQGDERGGTSDKSAERRASTTADQRGGRYQKG